MVLLIFTKLSYTSSGTSIQNDAKNNDDVTKFFFWIYSEQVNCLRIPLIDSVERIEDCAKDGGEEFFTEMHF